MSTTERILWAFAGLAVAVSTALAWARDEREIKRIQRAHGAEMRAIREGRRS